MNLSNLIDVCNIQGVFVGVTLGCFYDKAIFKKAWMRVCHFCIFLLLT